MPAPGFAAVLLDVEGTTTPISFFHDVLFPYAARCCEGFLARRREEPEVREALRLLAKEHRQESARQDGTVPAFGDGIPYLRFLIANDHKSAGLKLLQGLVWQEDYESGRLRGEVFADVPPAFAAWRRAGVRLRIFSSGSVLAQRLLFSTTPEGDLTSFLEGFHDLATGPSTSRMPTGRSQRLRVAAGKHPLSQRLSCRVGCGGRRGPGDTARRTAR